MQKTLLQDLRLFFILSFISIFLITADFLHLLNFPKSIVQIATVPIQYGIYNTGLVISKQFEFIFLARRAAKENKAITQQMANVLSENARLRRELAEAQGFLSQQNSLSPQTFKLVPARIVGVDKSRFLLIDKGTNDNLLVDQPVVFKDNYIGKITHLSPKQSQVILSSDPDSKIAAFVSSKDGKAKGILTGQFGQEMLLDKILHSEPISQGDLVYSEGTEGNLPRGLILGSVTQILERQNEIFKQAKVKPIFDIADLDVVFVITD